MARRVLSGRVHDRYQRRLKDLPLAEQGFVIRLTVRRFVCGSVEQADRKFRHLGDTNSLDADAPERRMQAHDASEAAIGAAEAQVGYILVDEIRAAAHRAVDDFYALNALIFEGGGDHGMSRLHNQTAEVHNAIGARVRAIYAGRNVL
ncbi:hypothetical protein OV320_1397 [Actinobacteria bacterium OV320]|nr:hypothetical protein OV320_1397 [Actinobacteria bacterium OV320]